MVIKPEWLFGVWGKYEHLSGALITPSIFGNVVIKS